LHQALAHKNRFGPLTAPMEGRQSNGFDTTDLKDAKALREALSA
jgi:hypothetical protein